MSLWERVRARMDDKYAVTVTPCILGYEARFKGAPGGCIQPTPEGARSSLLKAHTSDMMREEAWLWESLPLEDARVARVEQERAEDQAEALRVAREKEESDASHAAMIERWRLRDEEDEAAAREEARLDELNPGRALRRELDQRERREAELRPRREEYQQFLKDREHLRMARVFSHGSTAENLIELWNPEFREMCRTKY